MVHNQSALDNNRLDTKKDKGLKWTSPLKIPCIFEDLKHISVEIRRKTLEIIYRSKSSHIGSCFSIVDILTTLYFGNFIRFDTEKDSFHDKLILSKGHAAAALYSTLFLRGVISEEQLYSFGFFPSLLLGHVSHDVKGVEFSSGSLGHGLSIGTGMALVFARSKIDKNVFVITSDGELNEGSTWEAIMFAGHHRLHPLTLIVDYNHIQSLGNVNEIINLDPLVDKFKAFGWAVYSVDGHDHQAVGNALLAKSDKPKALIADTIKGKGVSFMEGELKWHYKNPSDEEYLLALKELSS